MNYFFVDIDFKNLIISVLWCLFVLMKVFGLSKDHELLCQKAFVSEELDQLFEHNHPVRDDKMDKLIRKFAKTEIEEDGRFEYDNVRALTGQPSERDGSTYRPFHWETERYYRRNGYY